MVGVWGVELGETGQGGAETAQRPGGGDPSPSFRGRESCSELPLLKCQIVTGRQESHPEL